jgi:tetratricopeptide (TPR) repeat protein
MKEILSGKVPLFPTQEKALKKILQERERGDLAKARKTALGALEKWPADYNLAIEAVQCCLDLSDYPQAANLMKNAYKRHADRRAEIMEFARAAFQHSFSTLLGSFIIEVLLKSRDLEGIANLLGMSPESFAGDLTKRGETRSKNLVSEGQEHTTLYAENELLVGIVHKENKQFTKSLESLGRAMEQLPDDAQAIGELLAQIEQEMPANSLVKFYLGLASMLLAHPEKAEARFFQCLDLETPPLDRILSALGAAKELSQNKELLMGEILMRSGKHEEGVAAIRAYLSREQTSGGAPHTERMKLAEERLSALPRDAFSAPLVMFLYCDIAVALGHVNKAVAILEEAADADPEILPTVVEWLEKNEAASRTAPAQAFCARIHLRRGDMDKGIRAARCAADTNPSVIPGIIALLREKSERPAEGEPRLAALLAELYARSGDRASAEETFGALKRRHALPDGELVKLAGEIMRHCGVFLAGVVSALDISLQNRKIDEAIPFVMALYREKPDEHEAFAAGLRELAEEQEAYWSGIAELVDFLAKEEELAAPFRFLQATAHLYTGEVERAVFEFDQLLMLNGHLRRQLIDIYRKANERFDNNATFHLALYHLYVEEESLAEAAHHLCRTLELDPHQIRDVIVQFDKLVEKEPGNFGVWEEMLKTSLALNHTSLAKEVLKRAIAALPKEKAAALHIYGARISAADGKWEDALRCIALTLTSTQANVQAIEKEVRAIIARDPANPQGHFLLGESLIRLAAEGEAVSAFRRCLDLSPAFMKSVKEKLEALLPLSVEPWLLAGLLGEIAWLEGFHDEAFQQFASAQKGPRAALSGLNTSIDNIRSKFPRDPRLALLHARTLSLEGRCAETVSILERLIAEDGGLTRAAADILISITADRPEQCDANRLLARIFMQSGDIEQSRQPIIRIMSDETVDPAAMDAIVSEFLPFHETNAEFLALYAGLKARRGELEEALARYRQAFDVEPNRSNDIFNAMGKQVWPEELRDTATLLATDCLIAEHRDDEAFALLGTVSAQDRDAVAEVVARLSQLIEHAPRRDYFALGASLLAQSQQVKAAENLITKGRGILAAEDALDLTIEFAEILRGVGLAERSARLFAEALEASESKDAIFKRIEKACARWTDREIATLSVRLEHGNASDEEVANLVQLALERTGPEQALEILCRSALSGAARSVLLGRIYLCMDQPAVACAALAAATKNNSPSGALNPDSVYLEGIARERAGDYGRAAANFCAIAGRYGDHADSRARALRNYTKFLERQCEERPLVLEKISTL